MCACQNCTPVSGGDVVCEWVETELLLGTLLGALRQNHYQALPILRGWELQNNKDQGAHDA